MRKLKILIVEHSEIIQNGLCAIIKAAPFNCDLKCADNQREINDYIKNQHPVVIFINPSVNLDNRIEVIKSLRQESISIGFKLVAIVYAYFDEHILALFDEVIYINDDMSRIITKISRLLERESVISEDETGAILSQREMDVVRLIALGRSNREMAEELFISIHTVISHRKNITTKLGIKSASGLTIYAVINKLINADDYGKTV
jgi:DNA-binding NarL/FixJ family response regulator